MLSNPLLDAWIQAREIEATAHKQQADTLEQLKNHVGGNAAVL
jgi:hypothetical protein